MRAGVEPAYVLGKRMNLLAGLLLAGIAWGTPGSAGTATPDTYRNADAVPGAGWSLPSSYSFEDIVNLHAGMGQFLPARNASDRGSVEAADGAFGPPDVIVPEDISATPSARLLFPTDELPEPAGWVALLCGLAAMAFMARRKRDPFAG